MPRFFKAFLLPVILLIIIFLYGAVTNPYSKFSFISSPFSTKISLGGDIQLIKKHSITFYKVPQQIALAVDQLEEFSRIIPNKIFPEEDLKGNESEIIAKIHKERFDTSKPYVISAGHFAELYVRNFGIFYSSILDGRFSLSDKDWEDRQRVELQTVATDLELLKLSGKDYVAFVPVSPNGFVGVNIYARASDSLFAVLWSLSALTNDKFLQSVFPGSTTAQTAGLGSLSRPLMTKKAGKNLLKQYGVTLEISVNNYLKEIIDAKSGLIKRDFPLSSARDQIIRQSSFYDNVIAWSTAKTATDLGLKIKLSTDYCNSKNVEVEISSKNNKCEFESWKQKIINAFWDEKAGIFLDDLSQDSIKNHVYSGDGFIVTSTKFLDFSNSNDRSKIEREITYVQNHKLDKPFPLRYAVNDQPQKLYFFNKYFASSYMGKTIWSHWGMEYIKTLIMLSGYNKTYLTQAGDFLEDYKKNIEKYGGYPELYDSSGNIYQTIVYKSLLHAGWVVDYEEAKMMFGFKGKH